MIRFSSFRAQAHPAQEQTWGAWIGWTLVVAMSAAFVSPKLWCWALVPLTIITCASAVSGQRFQALAQRFSLRTLPYLLAAVAWPLVTLWWTPEPGAAAISLAVNFLILLGLFNSEVFSDLPAGSVMRIREGLWAGFIAALIYQIISAYSDHVFWDVAAKTGGFQFNEIEQTREIVPYPLLIGPALLAIQKEVRRPWSAVLACLVVLGTLVAVFKSPNETSKLALIAWFAMFAICVLSPRAALRLVQVAWVMTCLLVVPAALLAEHYKVQRLDLLQLTAKERVLIWKAYADLTGERPFAGYGYNASRALEPVVPGVHALIKAEADPAVAALDKVEHRAMHPHNAYLQVWFELGGAGAVIMLGLGFWALSKLQRFTVQDRAFLVPTALAAMVAVFSSYGIWQFWLVGSLVFTALAGFLASEMAGKPSN